MSHHPSRFARPLALGALAVTALGASAPAAQAGDVDFLMSGARVVQTLQDPSMPLVAGRSTMIRGLVRMSGDPGPVPVDGILRVYVDGVEAPESPIFSDNGPFPAMPLPDLSILDGTLNFSYVPPASGDVVFEIEINPAGPNHVPESNAANNINSTNPMTFNVRNNPTFAYAPIDYRPSGGGPNLPDNELIKPGVGDNFIQGIYPGDEIYYRRIDAPSKLWTSSLSGTGSSLNNSLLVDANSMVPSPDFIYGWVPGSLPYNGQALIGDKASMGNTQPIRHQRTYAHEVGHNFGLFHNNSNTNTIGIDVEHHLAITETLPQLKDVAKKDIMAAGLLTHQAWVMPGNYSFFYSSPEFANFDGFQDASAPASGPAFMVCGLWDRAAGEFSITDSVSLDDAEYTEATPLASADLLVRVHAGGEVVQELPLVIKDSLDSCDRCASDAPGVTPVVGFHAVLPQSYDGDAIGKLEVLDRTSATETLVMARSNHAPEVAFSAPTGSLVDGSTLTVAWNATDADGDELISYLRYSPDGTRFVPLVSSLPVSELQVDLSQLPALVPGQGFFDVQVSDGLNTTRARTELLSAPSAYAGGGGGATPWVHVMTPDSGTSHEQGANIILHSSGWDLEDFALDGASIQWSSNVDGAIGQGRHLTVASLTPGVHVLTVTATDSGGQMETDTTTITVVPRGLPDVGGDICQTDLGFGGPGSALLEVCGGDLSSGTSATVSLTGAAANAPAFFAIGSANTPTPLKGGMLVPIPLVAFVPLTTDGAGDLSFPIPGGNGPATAYVQFVITDGAQTLGYAFSNAVEVQLLP